MIVTEQKPLPEILEALREYQNIFLVGCGECAATCKTGGEPELLKIKQELEKQGKLILGACIPSAPCIASQIKGALAKNIKALRSAETVLVLACGLGVQSVKDNDRIGLAILPALNTLFGAVLDAQGNFYEKCSLCGQCLLEKTSAICPITLCPKGLLNGPCGGMNQGKCEIDKDQDCAWVLIYQGLEKQKRLSRLKEIQQPRDFQKATRPHKLVMIK